MKRPTEEGERSLSEASEETVLPEESGWLPSATSASAFGAPVARREGERLPLPGRYEDLGVIAGGAFGEVHRVLDHVLGRTVAMKLLREERSEDPRIRQRFLVEARITAQLQHPGIIAVHDRGELRDGRLWYTMKEVRGVTLGALIRELHGSLRGGRFQATPSGWTFRRLIDSFSRIVQAVAYAHAHGVIHRDLKPDNLMIGELGEVLVMDWGLARRLPRAPGDPGIAEAGLKSDPAASLTPSGGVIGTPAYMPPEQARGQVAAHGPRSDVYALGAILYALLSGRPPYAEHRRSPAVLVALLSGPPRPIREATEGGPGVPEELLRICERAMRWQIEERYEDASAMAEELLAWLDGARRRQQGLAALEQARAQGPEIAVLRERAGQAEAEARAIRSELRAFDPVEKKRPAWALEDRARELRQQAALAEARWLSAVHGALTIDPELSEAHALLADHYRERLIAAELERREEEAARAEELLRVHDRGRHAAFLRGDGRLSLLTDPPGAEVIVERYELRDRRLIPVRDRLLGPTPLVEASLPRGSYRLRLHAPGHAEVRYPVQIERDGHWDGCPPGEREAFPIRLPKEGELGPDEVYVPAGWCWTGDPEAPDGLPRRRIWVGGLVARRFPVTVGEYLAFLNDLLERGEEARAVASCPKTHKALTGEGKELAFDRDGRGRFLLPPDREGLRWRLDAPIVLVDWPSTMAYARWLAARTGSPWRLPDELEREKLARGVDGRAMPWGDELDPIFANGVDTSEGEAARRSVHSHPTDESPYGVRGLAGNVRDWCINLWRHEGPRIEGARLVVEAAPDGDPDFRAIRGGAWTHPLSQSRAAARFGGRPAIYRPILGFRLVRPFGG